MLPVTESAADICTEHTRKLNQGGGNYGLDYDYNGYNDHEGTHILI